MNYQHLYHWWGLLNAGSQASHQPKNLWGWGWMTGIWSMLWELLWSWSLRTIVKFCSRFSILWFTWNEVHTLYFRLYRWCRKLMFESIVLIDLQWLRAEAPCSWRSQLLPNQNWSFVTTAELNYRNHHSVCCWSCSQCCQNTLCAYVSVRMCVWTHACLWINICMATYGCARGDVHAHVLKHTLMRVHTDQVCIPLCGHISAHPCLNIHMNIHICINKCIFLHHLL